MRHTATTLLLFLAIIAGPCAQAVEAANLSWSNPADGLWSDGSNWSGGNPPGPGDTVSIAVSGSYTVTLDVDVEVDGITVGAATGEQTVAVIDGYTLTVGSSGLDVLANGRFFVDDGTIDGSGTIEVDGTLEMRGDAFLSVDVSLFGLLFVNSTPNEISGSFDPQAGSTTRIDPTNANLNSSLIVTNGFTNHGTVELTNTGSAHRDAKFAVSGGTLVNAADGTIFASRGSFSAGTRTLDAVLDNEGILDVQHTFSMSRADADHVNSGNIEVTNNGSFTLTQSGADPTFTHSGNIHIDVNRIMTIQSGTFTHDPGTTSGDGTLRCEDVNVVGVTHGSGAAVLLLAGGNQVDNLDNAGPVHALDIDNVVTQYTSAAGSLIRIDPTNANLNSTLTVSNGFTNQGTIELTNTGSAHRDAKFAVSNGTLVNAADGTIFASRGNFSAGTRTLDAVLDNEGLLDVQHTFSMSRADADHVNSGDIEVTNNGSFTLTQSGVDPTFTHTGNVQIDANRILTILGGAFFHDPGTTSGDGTLRCEDVSIVGVTHGSGAAVLLLAGGNQVDNLDNAGSVHALDIENVVAHYTSVAGSLIRIDPTNVNLHSELTVTNEFINHGTIELTNTGSAHRGAKFVVSDGTLVNSADGTIFASRGNFSAGTRTLDAVLDNEGLLDVQHTFSMARADADHINSGDIEVTNNGTFTLTQSGTSPSLTHTGNIHIDVNRLMTIQDGDFFHDPGTTSGQGTLRLEGVRMVDVTHNQTSAVLLLAGDNSIAALTNDGTVAGLDQNNVISFCTTGPSSVLRIDPTNANRHSDLQFRFGLTNHGLIELTNSGSATRDARLTVDSGTLTNAPDGTIQAARGTFSAGTRTLNAQLNNQGLVDVRHTFLLDEPDAQHLNSGTFSLSDNASFTLNQTGVDPRLTHVGLIEFANSRKMTIQGGQFLHDPGTTQGAGALRCEGVELIGVTHSAESPILELAGNNSVDELSNAGTIVATSLSNLVDSYSTSPGSITRVDPTTANLHSELVIGNGFTNQGRIELTNSGSAHREARIAVTSGILFNVGGAVLESSRGAFSAGTRQIDAAVDNQGTLIVEQPLTVVSGPLHQLAGALLAGSGSLDVSAVEFLNDGTTAPGSSAGTLSIIGPDTRSATSALNIEIGGRNTNQYDRLAVSDSAHVVGALNISFIGGFEPSLGDSFSILTSPARQGLFDIATGLVAPNGLKLEISYKEDRIDLLAGEAGTNEPPVAVNDSVTVGEDLIVDVDVLGNDFDLDSDSLSVVAGTVSTPPHGFAVLGEDQTIRYTPDFNFVGVDSFTYIVSDLEGGDDMGTVYVEVTPRNDGPKFLALSSPNVVVLAGQQLEILAVATDVDEGDIVTLTSSELPPGATLSPPLPLEGNPVFSTFTWIPTEEDEGIYDLTFFATDDSLAQDALEFTIEVQLAVSSTPDDETLEEQIQDFGFDAVWPNPSRGPVQLDYSVPTDAAIRLAVYDIQGRQLDRLVDGMVEAGRHTSQWDGTVDGQPAAAGVYLLRLEGPDKSFTKRIVITK